MYESESQVPVFVDTMSWGTSGRTDPHSNAHNHLFCADSSLQYVYQTQPFNVSTTCMDQSNFFQAPSSTDPLKHSIDEFQFHQRPSEHKYFPQDPTPLNTNEASRHSNVDGVDLYEARIAKECTEISRQAEGLPSDSFGDCCVCLSANASAQIHACGHTFHSKCFLRWFRSNRSCPLCRGHVDRMQLASAMRIENKLDAIMADMEDVSHQESQGTINPLEPSNVPGVSSSLGGDAGELMSFWGPSEDHPMDLVDMDDVQMFDEPCFEPGEPKLDLPTESFEKLDEMQMECEGEPVMDFLPKDEPVPPYDGSSSMQSESTVDLPYAPSDKTREQESTMYTNSCYMPSSTMPNYWFVLNNGAQLGLSRENTSSPVVSSSRKSSVVHIAPKPEPSATPQPMNKSKESSVKSVFHDTDRSSLLDMDATEEKKVVSCRCTGGCRNGRCACVKNGGACGVHCRCTSCMNPFMVVSKAGIDVKELCKDDCFMHNVPKIKEMEKRIQEQVAVPCCKSNVCVLNCVMGYTCETCGKSYSYSWCQNKLCDDEKYPRNHCSICKRCCDHRDVHCYDCGRCYFAGVSSSFPCPCKEAKRKREAAAAEDSNEDGDEDEEEGCVIM